MDKKKKIIIISIAILIILVVILAILLIDRKKNYNYEYDPPTEGPEMVIENYIQRVNVRNEYFLISNIITTFYDRCEGLNSEYNDDESIKELSQNIFNTLDTAYTEKYNITSDNIKDNMSNIDTYNPIINDIYCYQQDENLYLYIIFGTVGNVSKIERTNFKYVVRIDKLNDTYSIIPSSDLVEELGLSNIKLNEKIDINESFNKNIDSKNSNIYSYPIISDEEYANTLFNDLKNRLLFDRENLFDMLEEKYKSNFANYEAFKSFCIENVKKFASITLSNYNKVKENGKTKYIFIDQNGEYYNVLEEYPMKYIITIGK